MRLTKQAQINKYLEENNHLRFKIKSLEHELNVLKNSHKERKLQMQEKIAYALAQNNEALSKALLAIEGVM